MSCSNVWLAMLGTGALLMLIIYALIPQHLDVTTNLILLPYHQQQPQQAQQHDISTNLTIKEEVPVLNTSSEHNNASTLGPLFPIQLLPDLPKKYVHWCHKGEDLIYQPLLSKIREFNRGRLKSRGLILLFGDSTIHEPFVYIAKCLFPNRYSLRAIGNGTEMVYTVNDARLQVLYLPNYYKSKVYSIAGNRISGKLELFRKHALPGYSPILAWTNFGALHLLHRHAARLDAGDFLGWKRLESWMVEDAQTIVSAQGLNFPLLLVSTPHSICPSQFSGERQRWAETFVPTSPACQAFFKIEGERGEREFCETGLALPSGVTLLQHRFNATLYGSNWQYALANARRVGVLDNTLGTETLCEYGNTNDGVHYEALVPFQVEAMFRFLFLSF